MTYCELQEPVFHLQTSQIPLYFEASLNISQTITVCPSHCFIDLFSGSFKSPSECLVLKARFST